MPEIGSGANPQATVRYSFRNGGFSVTNGATMSGVEVQAPTKERPMTLVTVTLCTFGEVIIESGEPTK
jgi:hypothetical protein